MVILQDPYRMPGWATPGNQDLAILDEDLPATEDNERRRFRPHNPSTHLMCYLGPLPRRPALLINMEAVWFFEEAMQDTRSTVRDYHQ